MPALPPLSPSTFATLETLVMAIEATLVQYDHLPKTRRALDELQRFVDMERRRIDETNAATELRRRRSVRKF